MLEEYMFTNTIDIEMDLDFIKSCAQISSVLEQLASPESLLQSDRDTTACTHELAAIAAQIKKLKSSPLAKDPTNAKHLEKVRRDVKETKRIFSTKEASLELQSRNTAKRHHLIVKPNTTDDQINKALVTDRKVPIFQQAVSIAKSQEDNSVYTYCLL
jgi:t-SNARE complex subunit (syntaxin)